jgi:hypothetical protein
MPITVLPHPHGPQAVCSIGKSTPEGINGKPQLVGRRTRQQARKECPWAFVIIKVDCGYHCFERLEDAQRWRAQFSNLPQKQSKGLPTESVRSRASNPG